MSKQIAIIATMIGQGTKTHLVTAEVKANSYYADSVSCGSLSNNIFRRSGQHSNTVLTETVELPETIDIDWVIAKLAIEKEALANLSEMNIPTLCAKCERDIAQRISWREQQVANAKVAAN